MQKIEQILDKAISRIKNGEEIASVVLSYPEELRETLSANLNVVKTALSIPKKQAPAALQRRLYLQQQPQSKFASFVNSVQMYALAFGVFILFITGTAYAAKNSLPGDKLFFVKRAFENVQISFAATPQKKADLQLIFANARLSDAQKVIAENDSSKSTAAINELNSQTTVALNNIKEVVGNSGISKAQSASIIKNVQNLADNQAKLVAKVDPGNALAIVQSNEKTVADIQKIIVVANDEAPAAFRTNVPIEMTGNLSDISLNSVSIDKNTFVVNDQTLIQDSAGNNLLLSGLAVDDNVKIQGQIKNDQNIAQTITLIKKAPTTPEKKADDKNTSTKTQTLMQASDLQAASLQAAAKQASTNQTTSVPAPIKPNDTFGGFIPESSDASLGNLQQ